MTKGLEVISQEKEIIKETLTLSIVIPALNEEKTIGLCVKKAAAAIRNMEIAGEVIVADNGSHDQTEKTAEDLGARVIRVSTRGYGSALMGGFDAARGKYLMMADADDSYNFEEIAPFVEKLKAGCDLVIGNRLKGKIQKGANPFLHRYLGTPVLTGLMNLFFKTGIGDVNCGMRALTKQAFHKMQLKAQGMEFATEMIVKAARLKLKIAEVPCNLYRDKRGHKPHLKTWQDGWRHLRFMLLFTPKWTFLIPGILLLLAGLGGVTVLFIRDAASPQSLAFITQKHMLSFMLLFLLGFQIIGLGLAAMAFTFSRDFDSSSKSMHFLINYFSLERGVIFGTFLLTTGLAVFAYLYASWYWGFFPFLNELLRFDIAVFAMIFLLTGVQMIFHSFLLSLFYLKVK